MKRRALLIAGSASLLAASVPLLAQTPNAPRRIAALFAGTPSAYRSRYDAFRSELAKLGYAEGRDIVFETRWAEDRTEKLKALAAELVALRPAAILTATAAGVAACKAATSTIPIVFGTVAAPVEQGFVASLRRPGGNVTGVLVHELEKKMVEIAREALPRARRLAFLVHTPDPAHKRFLAATAAAAEQFKFELVVGRVGRVEELALAFNEIVDRKPDLLVLPIMAFMNSNFRYLIERSLAARLPLLSGWEEATAAGALLSYGTSREESYRRAATLVDKILRGAKPGDLPVEQPEKFQLVVNMKTAKAIGISPSKATLQRADRVIE